MKINSKPVSTTQVTNYISVAGVIVMIAGRFGFDFQAEDVATLTGAGIAFYGAVSNFVHRYRKGDITVTGVRK